MSRGIDSRGFLAFLHQITSTTMPMMSSRESTAIVMIMTSTLTNADAEIVQQSSVTTDKHSISGNSRHIFPAKRPQNG